uniref:PPUP8298 n=1 Tax=Poeciliopsis prolifica TaxID=188132 RepID=A0A0S7EUD5_9TELE
MEIVIRKLVQCGDKKLDMVTKNVQLDGDVTVMRSLVSHAMSHNTSPCVIVTNIRKQALCKLCGQDPIDIDDYIFPQIHSIVTFSISSPHISNITFLNHITSVLPS